VSLENKGVFPLLIEVAFRKILLFFNTSQKGIPKRQNWLVIFGEEYARSFCTTAVDKLNTLAVFPSFTFQSTVV
jgi:hypothetical protein